MRERIEYLKPGYIELLDELLDGFRRFMSAQRGKDFRPHRITSLRERRFLKGRGNVTVSHGEGWTIAYVGQGSMRTTTYWLTTEGEVLKQNGIGFVVPERLEGSPGSIMFQVGPDHLSGIGTYWPAADTAVRNARTAGHLLRHPDSASRAWIDAAYNSFEASMKTPA